MPSSSFTVRCLYVILSVDLVELLLPYVSCVPVNAVVVMLEMFIVLRTFSAVVFATLPILTDWGVVLCRDSVTDALVTVSVIVSLIVLTEAYIMLWRDSAIDVLSSVYVVASLPLLFD